MISLRPACFLSWPALAAFLLTGCMTTQTVPYGDKGKTGLSRTVEATVHDVYYNAAPTCVTILPIATRKTAYGTSHRMIEDAFARHLRMRIPTVIDRRARTRLARNLAVDLDRPEDRRPFARATGCDYFLKLRPWRQGDTYLLFWSYKALGVEAELVTADGKTHLWRARHVARRSDGGLPLGPVSAAIQAFEAGSHATDRDIQHSLADDLARRLIETLPDLRSVGPH